ncbi:MAG TPA: hypothetical protein VHD61_07985 [Lacunisphaera sp.]|nr:hypothetical protein [Lacunisphaera sp.]
MKSYRLSRRGFVPAAPEARDLLQRAGGRFVEEYECHDAIWLPRGGPAESSAAAIRIRRFPRDQGKPTIVTQKSAEFRNGIKTDHQVFSLECRTESDLRLKMAEFERKGYRHAYGFSRTGWQYDFADAAAFVELIEFLEPSVEICADAEPRLSEIATQIGLSRFIECSLAEYVRQVLARRGPSGGTSGLDR